MLVQADFDGNPYVGVYTRASEEILLLGHRLPSREVRDLERALGARALPVTIAGTAIIGAMVALNSRGVIVPNVIADAEFRLLKRVGGTILDHRLNALGNNILCNDRAALVNPDYEPSAKKTIEDALGVEVASGTIAGMKTVGSVAVATNKGLLCHPHLEEWEKESLEALFHAKVATTTANYGAAQIGACLVANSKGAAVGSRTTPIEMGRIEEGLGLY